MSVLTIVAWFLVAIVILVSIHELGHFSVARLCGVKVLRFSIGFGQRLLTLTDKRGTEYSLSLIPLGGYVKMLDEREGEVPADDLPHAYNRQPVWRRIAILAAGPLANFILAFFLYITLFMNGTTQLLPIIDYVETDSIAARAGLEKGQQIIAVDGTEVASDAEVMARLISRLGESGELLFTVRYPESSLPYDISVDIRDWLKGTHAPDPLNDLGLSFFRPIVDATIAELVDGGAAHRAGFEVGDELISVQGREISTWQEWVSVVKSSPGEPLEVIVKRNLEMITLELTPEAKEQKGARIGFAGVMASVRPVPQEKLTKQSFGLFESFAQSADKTIQDAKMVLLSIKKLLVGDISTKNLSGPIGIAKVAATQAQYGVAAFVAFLAYLSVVLGVMNLLPIPVLDGGHIVYCLIEWVAGKPVPEKIQLFGLQAGLAVLAGVMVLAFYNDIVRL